MLSSFVEARKWADGRGKTISAEESKDDFMRAQQSMADMQAKVHKMEMENRAFFSDENEGNRMKIRAEALNQDE